MKRRCSIAVAAILATCGLLAGCGGPRPRIPLEFGIYPGGPVGTVGTADYPRPENPVLRLAALESLRGVTTAGHPLPFIIRLYEAFTGDEENDSWMGPGANANTDRDINAYSAEGFDIDVVVRYEPLPSLGGQSVALFLQFLRGVVDHYAPDRHVRFLQVANEVNVTASPSSSDGYYPGAVAAVVSGVEAAAAEVSSHPLDTLQVGFNWAEEPSGAQEPLWASIARQGPRFRESLGWVGLDDYPGTFTSLNISPKMTGATLARDAAELRRLMTESGLPGRVPMHISETGYPTGGTRSLADQSAAIQSIVTSVWSAHQDDNIRTLEWFDLRDSNDAVPNPQEHYGLLTDRYKPKPSFALLERLIDLYHR